MSEAHSLFAVLCKSADADCATALERLVREAPDRRLNRINVLDFARREGLNEQRAITTFLHATQIGLLDMSWNVLCPSCGGVLDANATLKTVRSNAGDEERRDARLAGKLARKPCVVRSPRPAVAPRHPDLAQRLSYSSWRRHHVYGGVCG
jgi:hypothetical protein